MKSYFTTFILTALFLASTFTASFAQFYWTRQNGGNPVLSPGSSGEWDDGLIFSPSVFFDSTTHHMWYVGGQDETYLRIGYATSNDGITWIKHDDTTTTNPPYAESDPVLDVGLPGSWEETWVYFPTVIFDGLEFHMWYTGTEGNPSTFQNWAESIGHATSPNGYNWSKDSLNPVLQLGQTGSWEDYLVATPFVRFDGATYHMWYTGSDGSENFKIGHATAPSPNGRMWIKDALNPIMAGGSSGSWDRPRVQDPRVLLIDSTYHMWYSGGGFFTWQIGHTTSSDGITWVKDTSNPVLSKGDTGSWDDRYVASCAVLLETIKGDSIYKMWYTGGNAEMDGKIGYATATFTGLEEVDSERYPEGFVLQQNYPNPFNPTTNIEFAIPRSEFVTLKIYNLLGQEVATLISEKMTLGNYKYTWDASNFASGIYYYKIVSGLFIQTRKLILLK